MLVIYWEELLIDVKRVKLCVLCPLANNALFSLLNLFS